MIREPGIAKIQGPAWIGPAWIVGSLDMLNERFVWTNCSLYTSEYMHWYLMKYATW